MADPERMHMIDSLWLDLVQADGPVAVGGVFEFRGKPPALTKIRARIAEILPESPRLRQIPMHSRTGVLQPKWQDVEPDLNHHVTRRAIPVGGLEGEISRMLTLAMPTDTPLWDITVLTGYAPKEWALVWRLHHSVADGEGVTMLVGRALDMAPEGGMTLTDALVAQAEAWRAERGSAKDRALDAGDRLRNALTGAFADAAAVAYAAPDTVRALLRMAPGRPSELSGAPGKGRDWRHLHLPLADVKAAGKRQGATINDVIMAGVTNGFRQVLIAQGSDPDGREVRAIMPVSRRVPGDTRSNNQVSAMPIALPVGVADPVQRLKRVVSQTKQGKKSMAPALIGAVEDTVSKVVPAPLQEFVVARTGWSTAWMTDTLVTNVRGAAVPQYFCGQEVRYLSPIIPIASSLRTVVGINSYNGSLNISVTGDAEHTADDKLLLAGIAAGIDELMALGD